MSVALISAFLLSTALMNVEADSLPYLDPPSPWWPSYSYPFRGGDSILREQGEKLLLNNAEPRPYSASAVIVLVDAAYEDVRDVLRQLVKDRWGIEEEQEERVGRIKMPSTKRLGLHNEVLKWPMLGEGFVRVQSDASPQLEREYQLTSQPYNTIASLNGSSQTVIRVSDGASIFDRPVMIMQVTRTDRSREWARSGELHGIIPLPWKEERWNIGIVTNTEIGVIEDLKKHIADLTIRYFVTDLSHDLKENDRVREKMNEAIDQFRKR